MIIGITGWMASGKDTVAEYLKSKGYATYSLSDVIRGELRKDGLEVNRENLRIRGNELRDKYGAGYLAEQAIKNIQTVGGNNWVIPSIRQSGEVVELRKDPSFVLWEINTPIEIRYERMKARDKNGEDDGIDSVDELRRRESLESGESKNAQQIDVVAKMSDRVIDNSGSLDDLYKNIDEALEKNAQK